MSVTREFVEHLREWPADAEPLTARCLQLLIDGLAVAAAGAAQPGPTIAAALADGDGGKGTCSLIGRRQRASASAAARVNGMAMHVLDFEPMWSPPNHAVSPLLPALLALAETAERGGAAPQGKALLGAFAKGIEAQGRLRLASRQFEPGQLKLHPPGLVGPIATALASACYLGLDIEKTVMAVGIAASRTGGIIGNVGTHTKALHCGDAAAHGLESALLAQRGFQSHPDALDGRRGWGQAYFGDDFDTSALLSPINEGRAIDPGPAWKLFPSQYATHFAITAALDAREQAGALEPRDVARIVLRVPPMPYIDKPHPKTGLDGKFSWQYTTVVALLDGRVDPASFDETRRFAADVVALLECIQVISDTTISGRLDAMHVELSVTMTDGRTVSSKCDAPLGSWRRPVANETLTQKVRMLLADTLAPANVARFFEAVALPLDVLSVGELMAAVSPGTEKLQ